MPRCLMRIRRTCSMSSIPYSCAMFLINWTTSDHDLHFKISGSIETNFQSKSMTRLSVILPSWRLPTALTFLAAFGRSSNAVWEMANSLVKHLARYKLFQFQSIYIEQMQMTRRHQRHHQLPFQPYRQVTLEDTDAFEWNQLDTLFRQRNN